MKSLNIGMVGYGFMGRTHSNAFAQVNHFFDLPYRPALKAICARNAARAEAFADRWGYGAAVTDWRKLVESPEIDLIDIASPNDTHAEIAIAAALAQGKPKSQIAREFKVSRPSVDLIEAQGKSVQNPANPLSQDWKERHAQLYIKTIDEKQMKIEDPAKAVTTAQAGLKGLGLMGNDNQVNIKLEAWLGSPAVQKITAEWQKVRKTERELHAATRLM